MDLAQIKQCRGWTSLLQFHLSTCFSFETIEEFEEKVMTTITGDKENEIVEDEKEVEAQLRLLRRIRARRFTLIISRFVTIILILRARCRGCLAQKWKLAKSAKTCASNEAELFGRQRDEWRVQRCERESGRRKGNLD